jgi:hypothetical protein
MLGQALRRMVGMRAAITLSNVSTWPDYRATMKASAAAAANKTATAIRTRTATRNEPGNPPRIGSGIVM